MKKSFTATSKEKSSSPRDSHQYNHLNTLKKLNQKMGIKSEFTKLDANENLFISLDNYKELFQTIIDTFDPRLYPILEIEDLKGKIGDYYNVKKNQIVIDNGSNQIINSLISSLTKEKDTIISLDPTFSMYKFFSSSNKRNYLSIPLKEDFTFDINKIINVDKENKLKIFFLCSPNNPTGNQFPLEDIKTVLDNFQGFVVIDEAYADFASYSSIQLVREYENLIVLKTFSKFFGLAGLKIGYAIANPKIVNQIINYNQMPYPVSSFSLKTASMLFDKISVFENSVEEVKLERDFLISKLNDYKDLEVFKSETNFILINFKNSSSDEIIDFFLTKGIILRNIGKVGEFKNCIRITLAPRKYMECFLKVLSRRIS